MEMLTEELKEHKSDKGEVTLRHPGTGEPLFTVKSDYGRNVTLKWHPHMLETHPSLRSSVEHTIIPKFTADNKSAARIAGEHIYNNAARNGFKDKVIVSTSYKNKEDVDNMLRDKLKQDRGREGDISDADLESWYGHQERRHANYGAVHRYHDPDTNELIGKTEYSPEKNDHVITLNSDYLEKHNLQGQLDTIKAKAAAGGHYGGHAKHYLLAKELYQHKGKAPKLTGLHKDKGYSSYRVQTTPEDGSAAHEEYIRKNYPNAGVTRTSPTSFIAHETPAKGSSGKHITSHVVGDILHSTVTSMYHPDYQYADKNTQMIG